MKKEVKNNLIFWNTDAPTTPANYTYSLFWKKGDNTKNTTPRRIIDTSELVDIIKSKWLMNLNKIERPYITPYGVFHKRNNNSLVDYNNEVICLDFDKVNDSTLFTLLQDEYRNNPSTILSVISPSGNGLKVLLRAKHSFDPGELYNGLKHNINLFKSKYGNIMPDSMQFVLSQPMFIPYCENPYYNPNALPMRVKFEKPPKMEYKPLNENDKIILNETLSDDNKMNRVNKWFSGRVKHCLERLENRPIESGTHNYLWSVIMRLYPFINQQTAVNENDITQQLERIVLNRYDGKKSEVSVLHNSIKIAKTYSLSIVDEINKTATIKI